MIRILYLLLLFASGARAQSLLMNGGFEDENICTEFQKNCAPEGWIATTAKGNYYFDDPPHAFAGQHFVGLGYQTSFSWAHYFIRSRLLCQLRKDALYRIEFYLRSEHRGLDSIGVHFSATDILLGNPSVKNMKPVFMLLDSAKDTNTWQKFSRVYKATGAEQYIVIGDFKKGNHSLNRKADLEDAFYYFIDQVSLVPLDPKEKLCNGAAEIKEEAYNWDERHGMLEKKIYYYSRNPPPQIPLQITPLQHIDTLVIPDVLFATNSYALNPGAGKLLDSFAIALKNLHPDSLVITGHTDSIGSVASNQLLSQNRAGSVQGYLSERIKLNYISRGLASEHPVADNRTPKGRQRNRRVEIYVYLTE
jgi:outer membrane protein OmpA-like peptidoglycan-associated protein